MSDLLLKKTPWHPLSVMNPFIVSVVIGFISFFYFFEQAHTDDYAGWIFVAVAAHGLFVWGIYGLDIHQPIPVLRRALLVPLISLIISWSIGLFIFLITPVDRGFDGLALLLFIYLVGIILTLILIGAGWFIFRKKTAIVALKQLLLLVTIPSVLLAVVAMWKLIPLVTVNLKLTVYEMDDLGFLLIVPFTSLMWIVASWSSYFVLKRVLKK